eukprot:1141625-Pelagomonas_calceolata.AAC.1
MHTMQTNARLLEGALCVSGEVMEQGTTWKGAPAHPCYKESSKILSPSIVKNLGSECLGSTAAGSEVLIRFLPCMPTLKQRFCVAPAAVMWRKLATH